MFISESISRIVTNVNCVHSGCGYQGLVEHVLATKAVEGARRGTIRCLVDVTNSFRSTLKFEADLCINLIRKDHVARWVEVMRSNGLREGTLLVRFRYLSIFFKSLVELGVLRSNPCHGLKAPRARGPEVHFPTDKSLTSLLDATLYSDDYGVRDRAIIRLLLTTGIRRIELVGMRFGSDEESNGLRLVSGLVRVVGKGGKARIVPLNAHVVADLTTYLRDLRPKLPGSTGTAFWLGQRGPITENTLNRIVKQRAIASGLGHLRPHQLRHAWANRMLSHEMSEGDVMTLGGWSSRAMLSRYGAYAATDRALRAARRVGDPLEDHRVESQGDALPEGRPPSEARRSITKGAMPGRHVGAKAK